MADHTIHIKADGGSSDSDGGDTAKKDLEEVLENVTEASKDNTEAQENLTEQLEAQTKIFEENDSTSPDAPSPKGPWDNADGDEPLSGMDEFQRVLGILHQGVLAITGVNSRLTKVLSATKRIVQAYNKQLAAATAAHAKANAAGQQGTKAQGTLGVVIGATTKLFSKVATKLAVMGAAFLAAGKAGVILSIALLAVSIAAKALVAVVDRLKEVVGDFSGALKTAEAVTRVRVLRERMEAAKKIGGTLASLERDKGEVVAELIALKVQMIDLFQGPLSILLNTISGLLKAVNAVLKVLNFILDKIVEAVDMALSIVEQIPFFGEVASDLRKWLADQDDPSAYNAGLNEKVLNLFGDNERMLNDNRKNKPFTKRFLN